MTRRSWRSTVPPHRKLSSRSAIAASLAVAMLVVLMPVARAQAIRTLSLAGPAQTQIHVAADYNGRLQIGSVGIPQATVEVFVDGVLYSTLVTNAQGRYATPITFTSAGIHQVQAFSFRGSAIEVVSEILEVETLPWTLTLEGPTMAEVDIPATYTGSLRIGTVPLSATQVEVSVNGEVAASDDTDGDGNYEVALTFPTPGIFHVVARARLGTVYEVSSPELDVEVLPLPEPGGAEFGDSIEFIYTGPDATQTGMDPGTIQPKEVAVIRGLVDSQSEMPLTDVEVTAVDHPEFGVSHTVADGTFSLVVNGGKSHRLRFEKDGYLPVERDIETPWRDFAVLEEVTMVMLDGAVTTINSSAQEIQVAQANVVSDQDGQRQATLIFAAGTDAEMILPDGSIQELDSLDVRATEYTVGIDGQDSMPAQLPPTSAYTYAVELSTDEALAADATDVSFDQRVSFYVENFLGIPVGSDVPLGSYDRDRGAWMPEDDGRVIEIVAIEGGMAELDVTGDGLADSTSTLMSLGIDNAERVELATLYPASSELWRSQHSHFSIWDWNFPLRLLSGVLPSMEEAENPDGDPCERSGSIIGCESQTLDEAIPIAGTPFHLRYDSFYAPGRAADRSLEIPLTDSNPPGALQRVTLDVTVAGRRFVQSFAPQSALSHTFVWDGRDAFGRVAYGRRTATVRIGYVYNYAYVLPGSYRQSFGLPGTDSFEVPTRMEGIRYQEYETSLGSLPATNPQSIGGWTLSPHHSYDVDGEVLHLGSGQRVTGRSILPELRTVAGNGTAGSGRGSFTGDGGAAIEAGLSEVTGLAVDRDGNLFMADSTNGVIRKVARDGTITTVAGGGTPVVGNGDGGPATAAELYWPRDVALADDGSIYIADAHRIRIVDPEGIISTFAGGARPDSGIGDELPATEARLRSPHGVTFGMSGHVFIADTGNDRVRVVTPGGLIHTYAGGGSPNGGGIGNNGLAIDAKLDHPVDVAVGTDGTLYVSDGDHDRIRAVNTDGIITTVAGDGRFGSRGDGGPAKDARLADPAGIAVDRGDGSVLVTSRSGDRLRRIGSDGVITTVAGNGSAGYSGDHGVATRANLNQPQAVAVGPDGSIYIADTLNFRVRRISSPMPGFTTGDIIMPGDDGIYHFDSQGRHKRTLDPLTGAVLYRFNYDENGWLTTLEDDFGNVTTIERTAGGRPTAIVSPFGLRTQVTVDANGDLTNVVNAAAEAVSMAYQAGGLLKSFTTPSGTSTFTYDGFGRLITDEGPDGTMTTLERTILTRGVRVAATTAEGLTTTYETRRLGNGGRRRVVTDPTGAETVSVTNPDGTVVLTAPDGTVVETSLGPDPRWGMLAPLPSSITTRTPGGRSVTATMARNVTLSDPGNLLTLATQTDTVTSNAKTFTKVFNAASKTITTTTAEGRVATTTLDAAGQVANVAAPGVAPVGFSYDGRGRLTGTSQGSGAEARTTTITYDADGFVASVGDSLHTTTFTNDDVGRVLSSQLPDTNSIAFGYDGSGNLTSLTPPGRTAHGLDHTAGNQLQSYQPPAVGAETHPTGYLYNNDRQPTAINLPGPRSIGFGYDVFGRLDTTTFSRGVIDYGYNAASQLSSISTPEGPALGYGYDGSLLTSVAYSGAAPGTTAYGYDSDLRVSSRTVNGGTATGFTYDKDGLVKTAGALGLTWDSTTGMLSSTALGGAATSYGYNSFGELETSAASHSGNGMYSATYERDQLGRITQMTETIGAAAPEPEPTPTPTPDPSGTPEPSPTPEPTEPPEPTQTTSVYTYDYDNRGRLTDVTKDGAAVEHYEYDANGNRTSATVGGVTSAGTYDARDRMESYGDATYTYLASGELATKTVPGTGTTTYDYDELGNQTHVELPNGDDVNYNIDGLGRRVTRKVNGSVTNRYQYGKARFPVAELNSAGAVTSQFIYASKGNVPDVMIKNGITYRLVTDQVGSVRLVVDSSTGTVAQRIDYDRFGKVVSDTNPGFQPFGFAGGLYDSGTGLVRFGHRDYDAETGRWTTRDPVLFDGGDSNVYAYVGSDPINSLDPLGLDATDYWDIEEHMQFWDEQAEAGATNPNPVVGFFQWGASKLLGGALDASGLDTVQASAVTIGDICASGWDKVKSFGSIALVGVSWYGAGSTTATGNSTRLFGSNARGGTRIFGLRNRFGEKFFTDKFGYFFALDRRFHRLHLFGKGYWFTP